MWVSACVCLYVEHSAQNLVAYTHMLGPGERRATHGSQYENTLSRRQTRDDDDADDAASHIPSKYVIGLHTHTHTHVQLFFGYTLEHTRNY